MPTANILRLLQGGGRRSLGRAEHVVQLVLRRHTLFPQLLRGLWSDDPVVVMRAADAVEKVTRSVPDLLKPHKRALLGLAAEATQQELRWHLAARERDGVLSMLRDWLDDRSAIVKTFALQSLADMAVADADLQDEVRDLLRVAVHSGSAAVKARARKLLKRFEAER
jgi:hypothetical protein